MRSRKKTKFNDDSTLKTRLYTVSFVFAVQPGLNVKIR